MGRSFDAIPNPFRAVPADTPTALTRLLADVGSVWRCARRHAQRV